MAVFNYFQAVALELQWRDWSGLGLHTIKKVAYVQNVQADDREPDLLFEDIRGPVKEI